MKKLALVLAALVNAIKELDARLALAEAKLKQ
jgi:hypothetical protein